LFRVYAEWRRGSWHVKKLTNWSFSRYGKWKKCPAILRYDSENKAPYVPHPAALRGSDAHKVVEDFLEGRISILPDQFVYYSDFLTNLKAADAKAELAIAVDINWNIVPFDSPDRWWRGILDAVVDLEDFSIIYDWKTGNEYAQDHRDQREIYAAAYHALRPVKRIQVFDTYFDKKLNTHATFMSENMPALRERWVGKVAPMLADEMFVPNPGYHCVDCRHSRRNNGPCKF
jgi:hypothetical protein